MSLREVLLPIQLASTDREIDRLKRSSLTIRSVYCGTDPTTERGSPEYIPASIKLKEKLHYISFRPTLSGFYRLHIMLEGRDYCPPVLLHILSDGTLLTSTTPLNLQSSGLVDPRPPILRTESFDADVIEPHTPTKVSNGGQVSQKFSELVQAFKVAASRHTDKSGVTIRTHKTAPPKLQSNKSFGLPDFLKRIRIRQKPEMARLVREMSSPATPPPQLRISRSIEDLSNTSIRLGRGSVRLHEYRQHSPSHQLAYICCICGCELDSTAVRLYSSRFCSEDFSRFYLQRNVREHFLVPVLQETYLPGLGERGALPQVNLKGLDMRSVNMGLDFFRILDDDEDGWIGRHQLSSLLIRILLKLLRDETHTKYILNSSPYKAMTSGMGLDKRGKVHEIEFMACFAFCVREYLDMKTVLQKQIKPRMITDRDTSFLADPYDIDLPDRLANRSSYHSAFLEDDLSFNISSSDTRVQPRNGLHKVVKKRVSQGDSYEPDEGWMMY